MDTKLVTRLEKILRGKIIRITAFGKGEYPSLWLEGTQMLSVAEVLKEDPLLQIDRLENLSAVEMQEGIVLSHFVYSSVTQVRLVLRTAFLPVSETDLVQAPSLVRVWSMVQTFEDEIGELFGVAFDGQVPQFNLLPEQVRGLFPMRKSFVFQMPEAQFYE